MTLKSAFEDLSRSTLGAISGCLQKLEYLAGLRAGERGYSHWGFGKMYGQSTANKALGEAHHAAVSEVLSTPLSSLLRDVEESVPAEGRSTEKYLRELSQKDEELLPRNPGPGSTRHLRSVLLALLRLERNRERTATRRAS
jgi:hypothetical protein